MSNSMENRKKKLPSWNMFHKYSDLRSVAHVWYKVKSVEHPVRMKKKDISKQMLLKEANDNLLKSKTLIQVQSRIKPAILKKRM